MRPFIYFFDGELVVSIINLQFCVSFLGIRTSGRPLALANTLFLTGYNATERIDMKIEFIHIFIGARSLFHINGRGLCA